MNRSEILSSTKSNVIEKIIRLKGKPISFNDYMISKAVLDCDAHQILLIAGRQVAKSFTNGADILGDMATRSFLDQLYVAPTIQQTKAFSTTKITTRIRESPFFRKWFIDKNCTQNVFEKSFTTECRIHFRAAGQLESIRGLEAAKTRLDEVQDFTLDEIIIIEATLDGQPEAWKYYAGTAKNLNNPIELLRKKSNQIVPVLKCPECGYRNIPYLDNIKPEGLFCSRCKGGRLSVRPPHMYLQSIANKDSKIVSFWIPQICLPLHVENPEKWTELVRKMYENPRDKFLNEVMGISAGTSFALITEEHLAACCKDYSGITFKMTQTREPWMNFELYAGVDWAITQDVSFTVISIGGFNPATRQLQVVHKSKVLDPNPEVQIKSVAKLCMDYNISVLGADWGSGYDRNEALKNILTPKGIKVYQIMYTNQKAFMEWDQKGLMYKASRTKTLSRFFKAIKNRGVHFPEWEDFKHFAPHYLAEHLEEGTDVNGNTVIKYDHDQGNPDDALHSGNYLRLMVKIHKDPRDLYTF